MKFLNYDPSIPASGDFTVFVDDDGQRYVISDMVLATLPRAPATAQLSVDSARAQLREAQYREANRKTEHR
jgi:hypothetical protein